MKMPFCFEVQLAFRFLTDNRLQTLLIITGISIGVAVLVFLTALIDGLQSNLIDKTVSHSPHISITAVDTHSIKAVSQDHNQAQPILLFKTAGDNGTTLLEWPAIEEMLCRDSRIRYVLPVVEGSALVRRAGFNQAVRLRGIELEKADPIYHISDHIIKGSPGLNSGNVLLGIDLAANLGVSPGDPVLLELPGPQLSRFLVGGVFDLEVKSQNEALVLMDRGRAASLLGLPNRITSLEIQVFEVFRARDTALDLQARIPGCKAESWQEINQQLLSALQSQTSSSITIQFFVLLAVILGVASVLAVSAVQKSKQIGILKAMGIRNNRVSLVFMFQGLLLGLSGSTLGVFLGILLTRLFIRFAGQGAGFDVVVSCAVMVKIALVTAGAAMLASYLPACKTAQMDPIEVIRNG